MISGKKIIKKAGELGIKYVKTYGWTFYHNGNEQKFIPPYKNLKAYNFLLDIEKERED